MVAEAGMGCSVAAASTPQRAVRLPLRALPDEPPILEADPDRELDIRPPEIAGVRRWPASRPEPAIARSEK